MFFKKKKKDSSDTKFALGMVLLNGENSFSLDAFLSDLKEHSDSEIEDATGDNIAASFTMDGEMVTIAHMSFPIPQGDIEGTAKYAYNWLTALDDTKPHASHLLVTVWGKTSYPVDRYKAFTQATCSLLRTTHSIGVYMGTQSLLIQKEHYLREASLMDEDFFPLNLWIYFGLRSSPEGNSGYTYGLTQFEKNELEIVHSTKELENIREFLFNITHYVLEYNVTFHDGQTCGTSENEKIPITLSPGKFVEGETFKLAY